jgi:long-subunit acyl-CoA synthetase (AMP-forming)
LSCLLQAAPFFDKLVFGKVKQRLGGNVKLIVSGGAPLAPNVEEFLKVAMCAPVVQVRNKWFFFVCERLLWVCA